MGQESSLVDQNAWMNITSVPVCFHTSWNFFGIKDLKPVTHYSCRAQTFNALFNLDMDGSLENAYKSYGYII